MYLGMTLDTELGFGPQVRKMAAKAKKRLNLLQCIADTNWGSRVRVRKTTYGWIVHPILESASLV